MWRWDQGHLPYFQFDALRQIAGFVRTHDFKTATRAELVANTGLEFAGPGTHSPWRQYARVLKLCLLVSESGDGLHALPTPVAEILSRPGQVTSDEYFHFLARAFTKPSPAFENWVPNVPARYPLLFCLKYLLAKKAISAEASTDLREVFEAYEATGFIGDEDETAFIRAVQTRLNRAQFSPTGDMRQSRESLAVLCQISYLHLASSKITVSLDSADAQEIFRDLAPIHRTKSG